MHQVQLGIRFRAEYGSWRNLSQFPAVHMTREAEILEHPEAIPIQNNFKPCDAMPGKNRMRMMIIMPAFAKGEDRDPPVVGGEIVGDKAARAPSVGDGVHHPGAVQAHYGADENSP